MNKRIVIIVTLCLLSLLITARKRSSVAQHNRLMKHIENKRMMKKRDEKIDKKDGSEIYDDMSVRILDR